MQIDEINLRIIKDSRKDDTLEALMKKGDIEVTSSVPQGKSRGGTEVVFLEAKEALKRFNEIRSFLIKKNFDTLEDFDNFLLQIDGTLQKSFLGGNLILVLSQCFSKLLAKFNKVPLWEYLRNQFATLIFDSSKFYCHDIYPYFFFNLINGGKHALIGSKFQEYLVVPKEENPQKSLEIIKKFFFQLKNYIADRYGNIKYGDEGGLIIPEDNYELPLVILDTVRKQLNYEDLLNFSLDVAANSFFENNTNSYKITNNKIVNSSELILIYEELNKKYHLLSIEDPFNEIDFESFRLLKERLGNNTIIVGDDLTTTNIDNTKKALAHNSISGLIIKPSQIGTVSETLKVIAFAYQNNLKTIISHRSGETDDDFIADLAVGTCSWGFKAGAPEPKERMAKYNRVIDILKSNI
ncbi:MAG: hypothetical protein ACP5J8_00915 [Minisyncoccia bacterium]